MPSFPHPTEDTWQVNSDRLQLLVILSAEGSWLRILAPIAKATEAQSLFAQLLEANFDLTQQVRYALGQDVLWGVFHHSLKSLTPEDFKSAIEAIVSLVDKGLSESFQLLIEERIRKIVKAAKAQGQSLETTYQTLDRFYQEGMLGGVDQDPEQRDRFLKAWKYQLERLWDEV